MMQAKPKDCGIVAARPVSDVGRALPAANRNGRQCPPCMNRSTGQSRCFLVPSPLYAGERVRVRGISRKRATRRIAPHPSPFPCVRGRESCRDCPARTGTLCLAFLLSLLGSRAALAAEPHYLVDNFSSALPDAPGVTFVVDTANPESRLRRTQGRVHAVGR